MFSVCFVEQLAERRGNVGEGTLGVAELVEDHVVGLITSEGGVDVVGVVALLRGVAQVVLHGIQVVEVGVRLRVHQDGEGEEDGECQVEVEKEEGEVKENHTYMKMGWNEDSRTLFTFSTPRVVIAVRNPPCLRPFLSVAKDVSKVVATSASSKHTWKITTGTSSVPTPMCSILELQSHSIHLQVPVESRSRSM